MTMVAQIGGGEILKKRSLQKHRTCIHFSNTKTPTPQIQVKNLLPAANVCHPDNFLMFLLQDIIKKTKRKYLIEIKDL